MAPVLARSWRMSMATSPALPTRTGRSTSWSPNRIFAVLGTVWLVIDAAAAAVGSGGTTGPQRVGPGIVKVREKTVSRWSGIDSLWQVAGRRWAHSFLPRDRRQVAGRAAAASAGAPPDFRCPTATLRRP